MGKVLSTVRGGSTSSGGGRHVDDLEASLAGHFIGQILVKARRNSMVFSGGAETLRNTTVLSNKKHRRDWRTPKTVGMTYTEVMERLHLDELCPNRLMWAQVTYSQMTMCSALMDLDTRGYRVCGVNVSTGSVLESGYMTTSASSRGPDEMDELCLRVPNTYESLLAAERKDVPSLEVAGFTRNLVLARADSIGDYRLLGVGETCISLVTILWDSSCSPIAEGMGREDVFTAFCAMLTVPLALQPEIDVLVIGDAWLHKAGLSRDLFAATLRRVLELGAPFDQYKMIHLAGPGDGFASLVDEPGLGATPLN